jgi:hypothetical protein
MRYPYDEKRANEFAANRASATYKQIRFILYLSRDSEKMLNDIMDSIPGDLDVEDLTKGQAMFVIKCLSGEIKPEIEEKEDK